MRFSVLPLALLAPVLSYYQPGDPPQCFDEYQCVFNRFPSEIGLPDEYTWDLRPLCAGAGAEYTATRDPQCNLPDGSTPCPTACLGNCAVNQDQKPVIVFNICGTVNGPIAPVSETPGTGGVGDPQTIPIPHSHGVALQYVEGTSTVPPAGYGPEGGCSDLDTCDQYYNPNCVPGSLNYDPANPAYGKDPYLTARADRCTNQGASWCSPYNYWCCSVKPTPCTKEAEVLAYYDGSPPIFNLLNEGDPNGISLSYVGALAFSADPYPCGGAGAKDPSTGMAPTRSLEVRMSCDASVTSGLGTTYFYERDTCQYVITTSSALACGAKWVDQTAVAVAKANAACAAAAAATAAANTAAAAAAASAASSAASAASKKAASANTGAGFGGFFGGLAAVAVGYVAYMAWQAGGLANLSLTSLLPSTSYSPMLPKTSTSSSSASAISSSSFNGYSAGN